MPAPMVIFTTNGSILPVPRNGNQAFVSRGCTHAFVSGGSYEQLVILLF